MPTYTHDTTNGKILPTKRTEQIVKHANFLWDNSIYLDRYSIENRRYIGCKSKLIDWIFNIITNETENVHSFCDLFAGTGVIANKAIQLYDKIVINDFLYSNYSIYQAFFGKGIWNENHILSLINEYNNLHADNLADNYFSINFGGKFFDKDIAKIIGFIREDIEAQKTSLTEKEYHILLASLIYSIDRLANTLGHFDAYIKKEIRQTSFTMRMINVQSLNNVYIYRQDANQLAKSIHADIVYMDPPYNSRQYSRFYHVYENLVQWKKPQLFGVAMKPKEELMSDYCRTAATKVFTELVTHIDARYIVVSYNNTYRSKSSSSENKIKLEQIQEILNLCGDTQIFTHKHNPFNSGKTEFNDHKEYLFVTTIDNEKRNRSLATILRRR